MTLNDSQVPLIVSLIGFPRGVPHSHKKAAIIRPAPLEESVGALRELLARDLNAALERINQPPCQILSTAFCNYIADNETPIMNVDFKDELRLLIRSEPAGRII